MTNDLLVVTDVEKTYRLDGGARLAAVRGVSLNVARGETLGIVGESGCGKSTLARMILHLVVPDRGRVAIDGVALGDLGARALRRKRRDVQMVFQDPRSCLDPRMSIADAIGEPLAIHRIGDRVARRRRVMELLDQVGLATTVAHRRPHELSGGQRQRVAIARALATRPALLVADEPVSALDVSVQAQILNLLCDIRQEYGLAMVFISHDLAVVAHVSNRIAVLRDGRIVDEIAADARLGASTNPYTRALVAAVPAPAHRPTKPVRPCDPESSGFALDV